jgi:hypothetical protein
VSRVVKAFEGNAVEVFRKQAASTEVRAAEWSRRVGRHAVGLRDEARPG